MSRGDLDVAFADDAGEIDVETAILADADGGVFTDADFQSHWRKGLIYVTGLIEVASGFGDRGELWVDGNKTRFFRLCRL